MSYRYILDIINIGVLINGVLVYQFLIPCYILVSRIDTYRLRRLRIPPTDLKAPPALLKPIPVLLKPYPFILT